METAVVRIYTRGGDDGLTGLIGGKRVRKDSPRVEACGSIDELNALLGVVRSCPLAPEVDRVLDQIQDDLFTVAAHLAVAADCDPGAWGIPPFAEEHVRRLEGLIDEGEAKLEPLERFILPGGTCAGALLHLARTVARRAERRCVTLAAAEKVDPRLMAYLNRLSDLCFVLARLVNRDAGRAETHPRFGRNREGES